MPKLKKPQTERGALLRRVRSFFRLTQEQMAARLGVNPTTICLWETGLRAMPAHRVDGLAVLLSQRVPSKERDGLLKRTVKLR
jgi:DNA-binding XRE family transcriptional regulator